jgi:hypothetical protein
MTQRKRLTHVRRLCSFECYPIEIVAEQTLEALMGRSLGGKDLKIRDLARSVIRWSRPAHSFGFLYCLVDLPCGGSLPGLDLGKAIHLSVSETRAA